MNQSQHKASGEKVIETMLELARCSKLHRIILSGSRGPHHIFELHRRGYNRIATTTTCGLPDGRFDVAFVDWQLQSIKALEATLDWLVHFLASTGVLVIWIDACERRDHRKLGSILERLGFRIEADSISPMNLDRPHFNGVC